MSNDKKQTIKCDVDSCKYNNYEDQKCELDEIKVSCVCDNDDCKFVDDTICDSFEEKDSNDEDDYQEELIDDNDEDEDDELEEFEIEEYVEIIETEEE